MFKKGIVIVLFLFTIVACKVTYSFTGTSISPDVKSITINYIENKAMKVNPALSNTLTEALIDKYRRLTKLEMFNEGGDLELSGEITSYDIRSMAVTEQEVAAQNRLTITVKIVYSNKIDPKDDFDKSFAAFQDYNSDRTLEEVEAQLVDEIVEILVEDIFNGTVANW